MEGRTDKDGWLTTAECAHELGVSSWFIRERIEDGTLPAVVITGGRVRYRIWRADLERYRQAHVRPATERHAAR